MDWLFVAGVVLFVVVLMVTVAIHEAGHMVAAKSLKLDVPEYSVGFGPKLFTVKSKKTAYSIRLIPLGGFVLINDQRYPEKSYERDTLSRVSPWKRQIVYAAGPAVNIAVGTAVLLAVLVATPFQEQANYVGQLNACESDTGCEAQKAGLQVGDEIVEIDGIPISKFADIAPAKEGKEMLDTLVVERAGERVTIENFPLTVDPKTGLSYMGIQATKEAYRTLGDAWTFVTYSFEQNLVALAHLPEKVPEVMSNIFTGEKDVDDPSSVVAAGKSYGDMAANVEVPEEDKIFNFIYYSALFNIGIGLINLLPLLPLDGGRMWIALCDSARMRWSKLRKIEYQPVTQRMFTALTGMSAVVVFGFMALIMASDVSAIFAGSI
jgi:membrane-associated protease RseP (regulator of RpoE activity)